MLFIPSIFASNNILLSEVYYSTPNEFAEFTIRNYNGSDIVTNNWIITNLNANYTLPHILNLNSNDYVSIRSSIGIDDLDAGDGSATIFLDLNQEFLDDAGDEVALYDENGDLVDFVRYNGGNQNIVLESWDSSDAGPSSFDTSNSIQIHGDDLDSSENWISDIQTEANPNRFTTTLGNDIIAIIKNGQNRPRLIENEEFGSTRFNVSNPSGALTLQEIKIIEEMLNFTNNFYNNTGFNPPATLDNNTINITLTKTNNFGASTGYGEITFDVGDNLSNKSIAAFLKWNIAHEFFHLLQYLEISRNGTPTKNGGFDRRPRNYTNGGTDAYISEGQADFWGAEVSKKEYNVSDEYLYNSSIYLAKKYNTTFNGIEYNLTSVLSNFSFDLPLLGTGDGRVYVPGYLFIYCIQDEYGKHKLIHIHNITRHNLSGNGGEIVAGDTIQKAFEEEGINKSYNQIYIDCRSWIYRNFFNIVSLSSNDTYNGTSFVKKDSIPPWGTHYEKVNLNNINSSGPYNISIGGNSGTSYGISLLVKNGSKYSQIATNIFQGTGNFLINTNSTEIVVVKTQLNARSIGSTDYTFNFSNIGISNSNISSSTVTNSNVTNTISTVTTIVNSNVNLSNIRNSTVINSNLFNVTIINSIIINSTKRNSVIVNSINTGSYVNSSFENSSRVTNSNISTSFVLNSTITNSILTNVTIINSVIFNSTLRNTFVNSSSIISGKINDTKAPVCTLNLTKWPPNGSMTFIDLGSGLKNITIYKLKGANLTPMPPLIFNPPTFEPVTIIFRKTNSSVSISLRAFDNNTNSIICDPVVTEVIRDTGKPQMQIFSDIPYEEGLITIRNYNPGLKHLDITVNKQVFKVKNLNDGEIRNIRISSAMQLGFNNSISLSPHGKPGGSAEVTIWEG